MPPQPAPPTTPTPTPVSASGRIYSLTDIGAYTTPGATAIDSHGNVVVAQSSGNGSFYYDHSSGSVARLPSVDGSADTVMANGINDAGKISGWSGQNAVVWLVSGGYSLLTTADGSAAQAEGINQQGQVAGSHAAGHADGFPTAWDQNGAEMQLDGGIGSAIAVSDQGLVVGDAAVSGSYPSWGPQHATAWHGAAITDLGTLTGDNISSAQGVSDSGEIVGLSQGDHSHAVLWGTDGAITDIGSLGGSTPSDASAAGINHTGEIVGRSAVGTGADGSESFHAFVVVEDKMQDLNAMIDPSSPIASFVTLTDAAAINCNGDIAANGLDSRDQRTHAYLLVRQGSARPECQSAQGSIPPGS